MLFIKGIYLLLFIFTNLPITLRAVWHTAVSCFYTTRCVASCFSHSFEDSKKLRNYLYLYIKLLTTLLIIRWLFYNLHFKTLLFEL